MWQREFNPFEYPWRRRRIVAVRRRYPDKNCSVGSCISVTFQFLGSRTAIARSSSAGLSGCFFQKQCLTFSSVQPTRSGATT
jgi:hypothetical protein